MSASCQKRRFLQRHGTLAQMEDRFGGQDWAVFAYHCGEGCVGEFQSILQRTIAVQARQDDRGSGILFHQPGPQPGIV